MGVKGLTSLLRKLAPGSVRKRHISAYKDMTVAIDVSCFLNRFIYGADPHPARVQRGMYKLCLFMRMNGIKPIFVFDGPNRIIEKKREGEKREAMKEKAQKSFQLERNRKQRLNSLKRSAKIIEQFTPDQVSSILEDIALENNEATRQGVKSLMDNLSAISLDNRPMRADSISKTQGAQTIPEILLELESDPLQKSPIDLQRNLRNIVGGGEDPKLVAGDINAMVSRFGSLNDSELAILGSYSVEDTVISLEDPAPVLLDEAHIGLELHMKVSQHFYGQTPSTSLAPTPENTVTLIDYGTHSLDPYETHPSYIDGAKETRSKSGPVEHLNISPMSTRMFTERDDYDDTYTSSGDLALENTGASLETIILPDELSSLLKHSSIFPDLEELGENDADETKVRRGFKKFLKAIERNSQDPTASDADCTRRQRELNALESQLIQEIKDLSERSKDKRIETELEAITKEMGPIVQDNRVATPEPLATLSHLTSTLSATLLPLEQYQVSSPQNETKTKQSKRGSRKSSKSQAGKTEDPFPLSITTPKDVGQSSAKVIDTPTSSTDEANYQRDLTWEAESSMLDGGIDKSIYSTTMERGSADNIDSESCESLNAISAEWKVGNEEAGVQDSVSQDSSQGPVQKENLLTESSSILEDPDDRDIKAMIKDVITKHQSVFMTLERRTLRITYELGQTCRQLLDAMGQPTIEALDAEAESVCAQLTDLGIADATVSEDTDSAVFGNGLLLREMDSTGKKDILEINPLVAREELGLSRDAFRDMCILCGTDFSDTMEGIGPMRAAQLMQYYGSIESIMANTKHKPRPYFKYDQARTVFDRIPTIPSDPQLYEPKDEKQPMLLELLLKYEITPEEVRLDLINDADSSLTDSASKPLDVWGETRYGDQPSTSGFGSDPFAATTMDIGQDKGGSSF
ncbi:Elongation of fatty acids protein 2 [Lunasporangiospora selenospora]|uniref:Elongation of fatty acids protein 2 n=1 Tax=Lunasporangiospora selenospora TaxID=979761 RepID=A0A9P6FYR1_9FUNG|nr:Elongation of fatty acids protein 2 [Lunasporangiospora selenospora]